MRSDGRTALDIRPLRFRRGFTTAPGGSVLVRWGRTTVLCTASLEEGVPPWLRDTGRGWLTAEYSMLPGATDRRRVRDVTRGRLDGRSAEIQRLIGRSLRAVVDLHRMPGRTIHVDCDVLEADGGTRTAALNGALLAVDDALDAALDRSLLLVHPLRVGLAAVSVGVVEGEVLVDLDAREDQAAEVDLNVVLTDDDELVEIQGTAEGRPFPRRRLDALIDAALTGAAAVRAARRQAKGRAAS